MSPDVHSHEPSPLRRYLLRLPMAIPESPRLGLPFLAALLGATLVGAAIVVASVGLGVGFPALTRGVGGLGRGQLVALSYESNGQLVSIWRDRRKLVRLAWEPVDLSITSSPPRPVASEVAFAADEPELDDKPPILTASTDLQRVVWYSKGMLHWQSGAPGPTGRPQVHDVSLADSGLRPGWTLKQLHLVADLGLIVETDHGVVYLDLAPSTSMRVLMERECGVTVRGRFAALACPGDALYVLAFGGKDPDAFLKVEIDAFIGRAGLALSPANMPAVASQRGRVVMYTGKAHYDLPTPGVARRLAYGDRVVLTAGDFGGIYLTGYDDTSLYRSFGPALLAEAPDVLFLTGLNLAKDSGTFAFANPVTGTSNLQFVTIGSYRTAAALNPYGWAIVSAVAALWAWLLVVIPWTRAFRERRLPSERDGTRADDDTGAAAPPSEPVFVGPEPLTGAPAAISSPFLPVPDVPGELVTACVEGTCVAFVGAGIGARAGLPLWGTLVHSLLDEMSERGLLERSDWQWLKLALAENQTDLVADAVVSKLPPDQKALREFLSQTFRAPNIEPTSVHRLLRDLGLSAIITSNLDELLEQTFADRTPHTYTHLDGEQLLTALNTRDFFILKLYGSLDRPPSVLLAPVQYYDAIARNVLFSRVMETMFSSRTLLFVGASLEGIEAYLNGIKFPTSMPQRHYALVSTAGAAWRARADLLERRYGITVLPFTATPGFPEVEQFLTMLARAVRERTAAGDTSSGKVTSLKKVTLENIGPFDSLALALDDHWNILLGDNGVGKSTILKAIAVGMIGADAAPYAGRLIKAGATLGRIILETSTGRQYITELRTADQRTIVDSVPTARAIDAERWLALGFPALRTFTWAAVKDLPASSPGRATSEDVLPLISGELDPRLDTLKAWLVDLDYRDARSESTHYANLRGEFFNVIEKVTPGMGLKPVPIDPARKEVLVLVNGLATPIRIEAASQGTQSLLGWVGILLQRLNDFYGASRDDGQEASAMRDRFALVLMDEIDAHMHPKWQQTIVRTLKDLFRNVQFIATTHSPLIVVGMEKREVIVVRRADAADVSGAQPPRVERPTHTLRGWSADQALTDPLFGLDSVIDPRIHEAVEEYTALAAKDDPDPADEARLNALAAELKVQRPAPKQRHEARLAFEMIEKALDAQLETIPEDKRTRVRNEVKVQIEENTTGSRRPG